MYNIKYIAQKEYVNTKILKNTSVYFKIAVAYNNDGLFAEKYYIMNIRFYLQNKVRAKFLATVQLQFS